MLYFAICDDNALHLAHTTKALKASSVGRDCAVMQYQSAQALLLALENGEYRADVAILDIEMDGMDGIALAKRINQLDPCCQIIFLTGFLQHATRAYDAEHVFYVLKSELNARFEPALEKAVKKHALATRASVFLETAGGAAVVPLSDILYMERVRRKTHIVTTDAVYETYRSPAEVLGKCDGRDFLRCHQSYYVNLSNATAISGSGFTLNGGIQIPISRSFRKEAKTRFQRYFRAAAE